MVGAKLRGQMVAFGGGPRLSARRVGGFLRSGQEQTRSPSVGDIQELHF